MLGEWELLAIVETLREFRDVLCGMKLELFTDHLNLTFNTSNIRVKRWRLLMEKISYTLKCMLEKDYKMSDTMSRIHTVCEEES